MSENGVHPQIAVLIMENDDKPVDLGVSHLQTNPHDSYTHGFSIQAGKLMKHDESGIQDTWNPHITQL
jgi:hypothetical protein